MTFKFRLVLVAALALLLAPAASEAQRAGFIAAGIAPPPVAVVPAPGQFAVAQPVPQWSPSWGGSGFIPVPPISAQSVVVQFNQYNQVNQYNAPVVVTQQTARPYGRTYQGRAYRPNVVTIVQQPISTFGTPVPARAIGTPAPGTSRADVLRALGQPLVTLITRDREELYFNGGVTVLIENGQVSGPK